MVDEVYKDRALVLRLDRAVDLAQFAQAHQQLGIRLDLQQQLDGMKLCPVLVHYRFLAAVAIPSSQETLHSQGQMRIAFLEGVIKLGEEELVVAHHAPYAQYEVAQGRAHPFALDLGMLGEHLTQQGGTGSGQSGHADKFWVRHVF
jgi:hypothetical protein